MQLMPDKKRSAACCRRQPPAALLQGIEEFNRHAYFECHETLEGLWNQERDDTRQRQAAHPAAEVSSCDNLYKGILQVGVGCYHLLRHNYHGATVKLKSGVDYLEPYAPECMSVQVEQLISDARYLYAALVALGPDHFTEVDLALLPQVRLV
ncbi:MAG: DUF309 domain-containing protein [Ktedonobacterales bacterium]